MSRRLFVDGQRLILGALAAILVFFPSPAAATRASLTSDTLTILFTGETRGNLLPCSCPKDPLGGLARRVGFLSERREKLQQTGTCLVLDAGGFLPEGQVPLRDDPKVAADLVGLLLQGMEKAGLTATALDRRERPFLEKLAPTESRHLLRTFLEADPPQAARMISWGERKVAILALEESLPDTAIIRAGCLARAGADLLIVLGRADAVSGRRLARLSRADLVLLSRGARPDAPLEEGTSLLAGSGIEGREVGEIRLVWSGAGDDGSHPALGNQGGTPRVRLVDFRLHPMGQATMEDRQISLKVKELMRVGRAAEMVAKGRE